MEEINSLGDLRPGDIMFAPIGGFVPGLVPVGAGQAMLGELFRVGRASVRHVGIVVEAGRMLERRSQNRHGVFSQSARLVQAMPGGAEEITITEAGHWTPRHAYVRLPEDYPGQAADAAAIARLMVREGVSYSWLSYAALAAWKWGLKAERLGHWIERRRTPPLLAFHEPGRTSLMGYDRPPFLVELPVEAICSVLVDQCWTLAGKKVMHDVAHQAVTPGALARTLLTCTPGAVWGWPRALVSP